MEDYKTPPAPDDRLAVVIIHGIGDQQPLDTLIPFVDNLIEEPAREGEPKFWSKPDRLSETFELRRLTARKSETRPTTDFYEYYWAHRVADTKFKQITSWAKRLLLVSPKRLHRKIWVYWGLAWLIILGALGFLIYSFAFEHTFTDWKIFGITIEPWIISIFVSVLIPFLSGWLGDIFLKYVGDAARYLQPDPENIETRQAIRTHGIELLRSLHGIGGDVQERSQQTYSRVVVVGHSLGSVIAYDILKHVWDELNSGQQSLPGTLLSDLERAGRTLQELDVSSTATAQAIDNQRTAFRRLQNLYWQEQRERAKQDNKPSWLVSDFITLGSPLVHADVLLNTSISSLQRRKNFRELPTCPPVMNFDKHKQTWRFSYERWDAHKPTGKFTPDHAAVFSATRWTNMYFPGDLVGDALAPVFGAGIHDIALTFDPQKSKKHKLPTSHTIYWKAVADRTDHMTYLRYMLDFQVQQKKPQSTPKTKTVVSFSKRDFMLGRQCQKALWLDKHRPGLKEPATDADLLRFELGNDVDKAAQVHYTGGFLVEGLDWALARHNTEKGLAEGHNRLYQAAFSYNGIRIRPDILDLNDDGTWSLREVKASKLKRKKDGSPAKFKDEHILDIAIQLYVLKGNNLKVRDTHLVLVHAEHVAGGNVPFFDEADVTTSAQALLASFDTDLKSFNQTLALAEEPRIQVGSHCNKPWPCVFKSYCWDALPPHSIYSIPYLSNSEETDLASKNILVATNIPDDYEIRDKRARRYVQVAKAGQPAVDRASILTELNALPRPFYFLDFETFATPLPSWLGSRPHEQVPFQFSCHKLNEDDSLEHFEFLHTSLEDPRQHVVDALLQTIGPQGSIMVYNKSFEKKVLESLSTHLTQHSQALESLVSRLFDQYKLVLDFVDHPELLRSKSLKNVSAVLLYENIDYGKLDIADGGSAQAAWYKMVQMPASERGPMADKLIEYCKYDTLAQVALHRWFMQT